MTLKSIRLDRNSTIAYNIGKGRCGKRLARAEDYASKKKPSPCPVAVSAFHDDRNGKPPDMKRDTHMALPPFIKGVTNRLPLVQRPAPQVGLRLPYHIIRQKARGREVYPCSFVIW